MLDKLMNSPARVESSLVRPRWRETTVLMVAALLMPFLVHLLPWQGVRPAGVYLLPVFWTAFVAVFLQDIGIGLLVALAMPVANVLLTGLPAPDWLDSMTVELVGYVMTAGLLVRRWPGFWLAAPLAYLPAKALAITVGMVVPELHDPRGLFSHLLDSTVNGAAGLGILLVINLVLVKVAGRDLDWDRE